MTIKQDIKDFFSIKGSISRRYFLINCLVIETIKAIIITIIAYILVFKTNLLNNILNGSYNQIIMILTAILGLALNILIYPSVVRRVRDIIPENDDNKINIISAFLVIFLFSKYTPIGNSGFLLFLNTFILFSLLFWEGKSAQKSKDNNIYRFNWGAFFGTWIWGLINGLKNMIFALPLFLTIGFIPYMFICALKGNEWVYEKNKETNIEKFHNKQKIQSLFISLFSPALCVLLYFILTITIINIGINIYGGENLLNKLNNKTRILQTISAKANFDKIEITKKEYKFYINPSIWIKMNDKYKKSTLLTALGYVQSNLHKNQNEPKDSFIVNKISEIEILNKIKIYSSFNNEILGEYNLNIKEYQKVINPVTQDKIENKINNIRQSATIFDKGYKFNNNPSIP